MEILTKNLPSGGYGYKFPSIKVSPMTFMEITKYLENVPSDPLEKYLFDINVLINEDQNILDCYIMDVDFLLFYKKLITVSADMTYDVSVTCPDCGSVIKKKITLDKDIHFKQIDPAVMNGARVVLNGHKYNVLVPTVRNFMNVFDLYLRYKKITDLNLIKTVALIDPKPEQGFTKDFISQNEIEDDILGATHEDITLLLMLKELYYDRVEDINILCPKCSKDGQKGGRLAISGSGLNSLIVDFFRELCDNSPVDGSKIVFK